ncbi:maleylpyruvate isomerase family mycothiol-dependent enzyme [Aeromicrobium sp. CF3.5]|uniref:maleylpyruvate isomerase family mycothiol-dependent enzyme n=1 Tax=Aeromicrobium sp. CF3.5 TaxID=3373078 RepID=UPI003EE596E7
MPALTPATISPLSALREEVEAISALLDDIGGEDWSTETPAEGWTVQHQVAHLISVYTLAGRAASDPDGFRTFLTHLSSDFGGNVAAAMEPMLTKSPDELVAMWAATSAETVAALDTLPGNQMVPWLVNDIPAAVLAMAGTTEAFAHGQDIRDAFRTLRTRTDHVRMICEFAFHTRTFGWLGRGEEPAELALRLEVEAPSGDLWVIGDPDGADIVTGDAWDLALLVTRRRHLDDLKVRGSSQMAREWLTVAQAYRGAAGVDRRPGQFSDHVDVEA